MQNSTDFNYEQCSRRPRAGSAFCHRLIDLTNYLKAQIFISQNGGIPENSAHKTLEMNTFHYDAICDDFGPMNFISIVKFVQTLDACVDSPMERAGNVSIVCSVAPGRRAFTNASFLLGAYMILRLDLDHTKAEDCFKDFGRDFFEGYRDASFETVDFTLELRDCWRGLERGKNLGWIRQPTLKAPFRWGLIDAEAYDHYDDPLNADLHEVVPGELVVFRGPKNLNGPRFRNNLRDGRFLTRDFSPEYCAEILKGLKVTTIIRLNSPRYDAAVFTSRGFEHLDLDFEGGSTPPPSVAARFFRAVDAARGSVAIHGRDSLGRAGTLAALHLMRTHAFGAREAIAWLRMMRPGAVLGAQQQYLANIERSFQAVIQAVRVSSSSTVSTPGAGHLLKSAFASSAKTSFKVLGATGSPVAAIAPEAAPGAANGNRSVDPALCSSPAFDSARSEGSYLGDSAPTAVPLDSVEAGGVGRCGVGPGAIWQERGIRVVPAGLPLVRL